MKALIGRKIGMMSIVNDDGHMVAVSLLRAIPNIVTQIKTEEVDGYQALQIGFGDAKRVAKPQFGHFKVDQTGWAPQVCQEIRLKQPLPDIKVGSKLTVDQFQLGESVTVVGTSKGKGFAGVIKRHNFSSQFASHGHGGQLRKGGSIGQKGLQRVMLGKKMPGRLGHRRTTMTNLKIAFIDSEKNLIGILGGVPGPKKGIVTIKA